MGEQFLFLSHPLAGKARKKALHVGRGKIARASLAIGLPNVPDHYWDAGRDAHMALALAVNTPKIANATLQRIASA
jgi:hypothetical protein